MYKEMANISVGKGPATLWVVRNKHGRMVACVARMARARVELEILSDGSSVLVHRFRNGFEAIAWAEDVRELWSDDEGVAHPTLPNPARYAAAAGRGG